MDRLNQKMETFNRALTSLETGYDKFDTYTEQLFYKELRDSVIKRFEYTIDYFWKFLKLYLTEKHGIITADSPKKIFDQAKNAGVITEKELSILRDMTEDRNSPSHMYQEEMCEVFMRTVPVYIRCLRDIFTRL